MVLRYEIVVALCIFAIATDATHPKPRQQSSADRRDAFLQKVLEHYRLALLMCTNEHNFVCTVDPKNKKANLMCIDMSWRCDGRPDCPGGEDEKNCDPEECTAGQVRCCDTGECATPCNDKAECAWGEDELNCEAKEIDCTGFLKCPAGNCAVPCDGIPQCTGGYDEAGCNIGTGCKAGEFVCDSAPGNVTCATPCDNKDECPSNDDEDRCHTQFCSEGNTPCETIEEGSQAEICAEICDGRTECKDARDEQLEYCKLCILCETAQPADSCVFSENCPAP